MTKQKRCEICNKFLKENGCLYYCSRECCLQAIDNMVCALGGTIEQAEKEVRELCGECVY